jgi:general stress protein YciG
MADQIAKSGRGWHGNSEGHRMAGRKGGQATAQLHGPAFYETIGEKGGRSSPMQFRAGEPRTKAAGRKGGKVSRPNR